MLTYAGVLAQLWLWLLVADFVSPGPRKVYPLEVVLGAAIGIGTTFLVLNPQLASRTLRIILLLFALWTWGHWPSGAFENLPFPVAGALWVLHLAWWPALFILWIAKARHFEFKKPQSSIRPRSQWSAAFEAQRQRKAKQPNGAAGSHSASRPKPSRSRTQPRPAEDLVLDSHAWMHGTPGQSLQSSSSALGAENTRVGILGERRFAKALETAGMLDRFTTFWSLHLPDTDGAGNVDAGMSKYDIDCIIQTQDQIWLIDVKLWTKATLLGEQTKAKPLMKQALWRVITMIRRWGFSHRYRVNACLVLMPADGITETDLAIQDLDLGLGKHVEVLRLDELLQRLAGSKPYGDTVEEKLLTYRFIDLLKPVPKSG